jgi:hypothetical protein
VYLQTQGRRRGWIGRGRAGDRRPAPRCGAPVAGCGSGQMEMRIVVDSWPPPPPSLSTLPVPVPLHSIPSSLLCGASCSPLTSSSPHLILASRNPRSSNVWVGRHIPLLRKHFFRFDSPRLRHTHPPFPPSLLHLAFFSFISFDSLPPLLCIVFALPPTSR